MWQRLSLRIKIFITLLSISSLFLLTYFGIALNDFKKDKLAFAIESVQSQLFSMTALFKSEIGNATDKMANLDRQIQGEIPLSPNIQWAAIYKIDEHQNVSLASESKTNLIFMNKLKKQLSLEQFALGTAREEISVLVLSPNNRQWLLGLRFKNRASTTETKVGIALLYGGHFFDLLDGATQELHILDSRNLIGSSKLVESHLQTEELFELLGQSPLLDLNSQVLTYEAQVRNSSWIVALSSLGIANLKLLTVLDKSRALEGVYLLLTKSILFLMSLLLFVSVMAIFSSNYLTGALREITAATKVVSRGDFNIQLKIDQEDEMGILARSFTNMAEKIRFLLQETAEKARMSNELKTAQIVQGTLFPDSEKINEQYQICGHFRSATECAGDWWYYKQVGPHLYMMVGDATGHGASAALITSAARSTIEILETLPHLDLIEIMKILNRGIYAASKGTINMSFFFCRYHLESRQFTYCNASHNPPCYIKSGKTNLTKQNLQFLDEGRSIALGRIFDAEFKESQFRLAPNDRIIFYTDGLLDLENHEGQSWGERNFFDTIVTINNLGLSCRESRDYLENVYQKFHGQTPLADDITFYIFEASSSPAPALCLADDKSDQCHF
jgi:sigma-B regulation protein RsbU (phosphoserine phosphatase)